VFLICVSVVDTIKENQSQKNRRASIGDSLNVQTKCTGQPALSEVHEHQVERLELLLRKHYTKTGSEIANFCPCPLEQLSTFRRTSKYYPYVLGA
jgi:hypothetical protein